MTREPVAQAGNLNIADSHLPFFLTAVWHLTTL